MIDLYKRDSIKIDASGNIGIGMAIGQTITSGIHLRSITADSGSAVAHVLDSLALTTAGSKLLSIRNNGVEKAYIDKDGGGFFSSATTIKGTALTDTTSLGTEILDANNWTSTDWTGSWAAGWTHTAGNTTVLSQATAAVINTYYTITWTVTGRTAGYFTIAFGGISKNTVPAGSSGTITGIASTVAGLTVTPNSAFNGTMVISVKPTVATPPLFSLQTSNGSSVFEARASSATGNILLGVGTGSYTTGSYNLALGYNALLYNSTGAENVALGYQTLLRATTGSYNIAIGSGAGASLTIASGNIAFGKDALSTSKDGSGNIAIGREALKSLTTNDYNLAIGHQALKTITSGAQNVAIGAFALQASTAMQNTALGFQALYSNTLGAANVAIGPGSAYTNTIGSDNVSIGNFSFHANVDGTQNIAIGSSTLSTGPSISNNIAIGHSALRQVVTSGNIAIGTECLTACTGVGVGNTGIGYLALNVAAADCSYVTAIGYQAGKDWDTVNYAPLLNCTLIGANAQPMLGTNEVVLGDTGVTAIYTFGAITSPMGDGASAVGTVIDTINAFSTTGAKLLSIKNGAVEKAYVDKDGFITSGGSPVSRKVAVPANAGSAGSVGDWAASSTFLYICTAANTWQRTAITLATW